jgi:hypothetical protein
MSKKIQIIAGLVVVVAAGLGAMAWKLSSDRAQQRDRPEHRDRYYDPSAIQESALTMDRPNATVTGVVVNNTWKTRDVGVWVGFLKSDGFHQGSTVGRNYYAYQYFPQVPPNEKRNFSVTFAVPPLNRSWSAVAEFDPSEKRLRPIW